MTAKNLQAWEVKESDYPSKGTTEERLKFLLRYAILAPSGPNSQPWKFAINTSTISLYADLKRSLPFVDPSNRTLFMSVGCALANLVTAGKHFGFRPGVNLFPQGEESNLVAEVRFEHGLVKEDLLKEDLFTQITRRHTVKDRYEHRDIDAAVLDDLKTYIDQPIVHLCYLTASDSKSRMTDLVARAHRIQLAKKEFRQNLGEWLRNNWTTEPDGMPLYTFGVPDAIALGFPVAFKEFDLSEAVIYRDSGLIGGCAALAVLTSDRDDKSAWVHSGAALERFLLKATSYNIRASFFSQPIGLMELREGLEAMINQGYPQLLLSLGYATPGRPTPRRPLEDVILKQ